MDQVKFNMDIAIKMKLHYQEEYMRTLKKLEELKQVLGQLEMVDTSALQLNLNTDTITLDSHQSNSTDSSSTAKEEKPVKKRKYKKRAGSKNPWVKFIKSRLKATQVPLSYDDMTNHAIAIKNLEPQEFEVIRKKIVAAAFLLRSKLDVIDTYAIKGSRTKYMGLKDWFEREGLLKVEFASKINQ
jgi:hypothetical protein